MDAIPIIEVIHKDTNTRIAFKVTEVLEVTENGKPMTIKEIIEKYGKEDWIYCK